MKNAYAYRDYRIEAYFTDVRTPTTVIDMTLKEFTADEIEQAKRAAVEDIQALNCEGCEHREKCAYCGTVERLPVGVKGGRGNCLRYFTERQGGKGFFMPNGEPLFLTDEAVEAIEQALKQRKNSARTARGHN